MKNSKYNLVPCEVIERAITGEADVLFIVQERHKPYIGRPCRGNADMKEWLNAKLFLSLLLANQEGRIDRLRPLTL